MWWIAAAFADPCESKLLGYDAPTDSVWLLDIPAANGGRLYYFGAEHSQDPKHPQFAAIESAWNSVKPTVAFYEGPERKTAPDRKAAVARGEAEFVVYLATRDGVPLARLEPDPVEEVKHVREWFPVETVDLFFILRQAAQLRERKHLDEAQLTVAIGELIPKATAMGALGEIESVEELAEVFDRRFSEPEHWWQAPLEWFTPFVDLSPKLPPQAVFYQVSQRSSEFRNVAMYRKLSAATTAEARVFAVVGKNHVPMQREALQCALGVP